MRTPAAAALWRFHEVGSCPLTDTWHHPSPRSHDAGASSSVIADLAWDPTGSRLAVALQAPHPAAGRVALYATSASDPVVLPALLGFMHPGLAEQEEEQDGGGAGRWVGSGCCSRGVRAGTVWRPMLPPLFLNQIITQGMACI